MAATVRHQDDDTPVANMRLTKIVHCTVIVLEKGHASMTKDGKTLCPLVVADETGRIDANLWDYDGASIKAGEIYCIRFAYTSLFHGTLVLYISGRNQTTMRRIGDVTMIFSERPNISAVNFKVDMTNRRLLTSDPPLPTVEFSGVHAPNRIANLGAAGYHGPTEAEKPAMWAPPTLH
eukprot:TRINITY_DN10910_c0_g1_i2.p1 TRINITY_DN10910_c0_g1~~TRINITY_DN10910_c0_g1_i2.p1  ORF type:complete len:197 (+),score=40.53 TRINITY_DN10910_c0_g1_i2:60-593(+)